MKFIYETAVDNGEFDRGLGVCGDYIPGEVGDVEEVVHDVP